MTVDRAEVVVIGAGLGGLSAAAHLASDGVDVLVLEHHSVPGGYAHEFTRKGYRFDVALHALDGVGPGGWLRPVLEDLGVLDKVTFTRLDPFYTVRFPRHEVTVPGHLDGYVAELKRHFPAETGGIDQLFATIGRIGTDTARFMADRSKSVPSGPAEMLERYPDLASVSITDWATFLEAHIGDPELRSVISTLWGYLGLPPSKVSARLFALLLLSYHTTGAFYPVGGSQALSRAIADRVTERGGRIRFRQTVDRIDVVEGRVVGVRTTGGLNVETDLVVSNASPVDTIRLAGEGNFAPDLVGAINADRPALSNLVVYLGLDRDLAADGWNHHEYFVCEDYDLEADYAATVAGEFDRTGMVITHYTPVDPGCAPEGGSVLAIMSLAPWDYADTWGTGGRLTGYRRNAEYRRIKADAGEALLRRAERLIPGLRESVVVQEVATPLTNYRYGLNPAGSIYGREQTVENMFTNRRSPRTTIPNLLFTGAWVTGGGMSTAIQSGRRTANAARRVLD